jgi:hypothetical protein
MARRRRRTVFGEPVEVLLEALLKIGAGIEQQPDGTYNAHATLPSVEGEAFLRAWMRSEAVLLRKDADAFPVVERSRSDRQGEALVVLSKRVVDTTQRLSTDRGDAFHAKPGTRT